MLPYKITIYLNSKHHLHMDHIMLLFIIKNYNNFVYGLIYIGVPTYVLDVVYSSLSNRANPKSIILISNLGFVLIKIFYGFISLCTICNACKKLIPYEICENIYIASSSHILFFISKYYYNSIEFSKYSITI